MKKSVVVLIGIIYVASIALVSFFGLKAKIYNAKVYAERVQILNDCKINDNGEKVIYHYLSKHGNTLQLLWRVYPDNTTDQTVAFIYDTQNTYVSVDNETGVVTFTERGAITITIRATDGSGASDTVKILAI